MILKPTCLLQVARYVHPITQSCTNILAQSKVQISTLIPFKLISRFANQLKEIMAVSQIKSQHGETRCSYFCGRRTKLTEQFTTRCHRLRIQNQNYRNFRFNRNTLFQLIKSAVAWLLLGCTYICSEKP